MNSRRRIALAVLASLLLGFVAASPAVAAATPVSSLLATLVVTPENTSAYDRAFFPHWVTRDGCDTRAWVLREESEVPTDGGCPVSTGRWTSYYNGQVHTVAGELDVDHLVPLSEAWDSGAQTWTQDQRRDFANDLTYAASLVAVTASVNRSKGDQDPVEWMPPLASVHCRYLTEWVGVKYRWNLTIDTAERDTLQTSLDTQCPGATMDVPPKAGTPGGGTTPPPEPTPTPVTPFTQVVAHPDFTGDRLGDLFAVDGAGRLFLYPGAGAGRLGKARAYGTGWGSLSVYGPGDWNGDGIGDLVATDTTGKLYLYPGNGSGGFRARSQIGHGWTGYRIVPAGDVNNDGPADLLAIDAEHRLWLYPGDGRGGFGRRAQVGNGWNGFDLHAAGDMNRDGKADILSIDSGGRLWFYAGRGGGYFHTRTQVGHGWTGFEFASGADFNADRIQDLMGRDPQGRLWFYAGRSNGTFATRLQVGQGW